MMFTQPGGIGSVWHYTRLKFVEGKYNENQTLCHFDSCRGVLLEFGQSCGL